MELEPCPFCGDDKITDRHVRDGRQMFCQNCGASVAPTFHGPNGDTLERAAIAWNTRRTTATKGDEELCRLITDELRKADEAHALEKLSDVARAILPIVRANQSKPDLSAQLTEAKAGIDYYAGLYAKRCGDLLEAKADAERLMYWLDCAVSDFEAEHGRCTDRNSPHWSVQAATELASYREKHNG